MQRKLNERHSQELQEYADKNQMQLKQMYKIENESKLINEQYQNLLAENMASKRRQESE